MSDATPVPSNQWNTPWRASGFAVYDTSGNLVAHTGITGNRSMHGKQLELMAAMIAEAVNAYSAGEPCAMLTPQEQHAIHNVLNFCKLNPSMSSTIDVTARTLLKGLLDRASQPPVPEWQPIETMPFLMRVLVYVPIKNHRMVIAYKQREGLILDEHMAPMAYPPSHWRHLPSTPTKGEVP